MAYMADQDNDFRKQISSFLDEVAPGWQEEGHHASLATQAIATIAKLINYDPEA
jgi:hypothetical protein